jgi:hypothetical protein
VVLLRQIGRCIAGFFYFQGFPCFEARMTLVREIPISRTSGNFLPLVVLAFFVAQMPGTALRINQSK